MEQMLQVETDNIVKQSMEETESIIPSSTSQCWQWVRSRPLLRGINIASSTLKLQGEGDRQTSLVTRSLKGMFRLSLSNLQHSFHPPTQFLC